MKTMKDIKALAHSLLESHLDKSSRGLMKPSGLRNEREVNRFLVGLGDIGEDILNYEDVSSPAPEQEAEVPRSMNHYHGSAIHDA